MSLKNSKPTPFSPPTGQAREIERLQQKVQSLEARLARLEASTGIVLKGKTSLSAIEGGEELDERPVEYPIPTGLCVKQVRAFKSMMADFPDDHSTIFAVFEKKALNNEL